MATIKELLEYKESNREKRQAPKKGTYWCWGCDRQLVHDWRKCPICGKRNGVRRFKKAAPTK